MFLPFKTTKKTTFHSSLKLSQNVDIPVQPLSINQNKNPFKILKKTAGRAKVRTVIIYEHLNFSLTPLFVINVN